MYVKIGFQLNDSNRKRMEAVERVRDLKVNNVSKNLVLEGYDFSFEFQSKVY